MSSETVKVNSLLQVDAAGHAFFGCVLNIIFPLGFKPPAGNCSAPVAKANILAGLIVAEKAARSPSSLSNVSEFGRVPSATKKGFVTT